jgi:sporulation protein YlmC with PRC-barrel domain
MLAKYLSTALIGSALMVAPAFAQSTSSSSSNSQEINASTTGDWQASQLIRLNVYNNSNEKIGDIKELMMKKDGQIDQVVIGVGGFLGIGTRDVAIKFSELKFEDQPVPSATGSTSTSRPATSGAGTAGGGMAGGAASAPAKKNYPDHAVLNMSKDQLQSMPQFNYSK